MHKKKQTILFLHRLLALVRPTVRQEHDLSVAKISTREEYLEYHRVNVSLLEQARLYEDSLFNKESPQSWLMIGGYCHLCKKKMRFYLDFSYASLENGNVTPNMREHLTCPSCGLNNRSRSALHLFELLLQPAATANIYVTEQTTPLFRRLKKDYPETIGSEYLDENTLPGKKNRRGIRNESLTSLTFSENQFDFILSFDVFEHIFDIEAALHECYRCLRYGGALFFTIPFHFGKAENTIRAALDADGSVRHFLPPVLHGDPLNQDGILCYHDFGWELLERMRDVGFKDVSARMFWSGDYVYLGKDQCVFLARKS